jgi:putative transcriptional regulator
MNHDYTPLNKEKMLADDVLAWDFLQGDLDPAESLLVATHYNLSSEARQKIDFLNRCASVVAFEELAPTPMRCCPESFFEEKCRSSAVEKACTKIACEIPKPLQKYLSGDYDSINWQFVYPGIQEKNLHVAGSKSTLKLLKIKANVTVPEHSHGGNEMTLVLKGSFIDNGVRYLPGDLSIHYGDTDESHAPYADQECICLVVMRGGLRLTGLWGKLLNPLLARL